MGNVYYLKARTPFAPEVAESAVTRAVVDDDYLNRRGIVLLFQTMQGVGQRFLLVICGDQD